MKTIFETVVYDGATKVWRILNVLTGTVYSMEYETQTEALAGIKHGESRGGAFVVRAELPMIHGVLESYYAP